MKFVKKEDHGEREEFVFEESKEKPKAESYPHISFGRYKNAKDEQVLLSHFSGPMRLGAREAKVDIDFSHLVAVNVTERRMVWSEKEHRYVEADDSKAPESSPLPTAPAAEEPDADLVNRGIEKGKKGDLDGAIADFTRAIELNPKDDAPYYNRAQAKWLRKDRAGAIADYTRAIELGSTNPAAYNNRGNARAEFYGSGVVGNGASCILLQPLSLGAVIKRGVIFRIELNRAIEIRRSRHLSHRSSLFRYRD